MKCPCLHKAFILVAVRSVCGLLMIDKNGNLSHGKEVQFLYSGSGDGQY